MLLPVSQVQTGMHRVSVESKIKEWYQVLFKLLEDKPEYLDFLVDKGEGDAPWEYLAAVEEGLRQVGRDPRSMGRYAMNSEGNWHEASIQCKKTESYTAVVRKLLKAGNYLKYPVFRWSDYTLRRDCRVTFINRHLQYSNGTSDALKEYLRVPSEWKNSTLPTKRRGRDAAARGKVRHTSVANFGESTAAAAADVKPSKVYNEETQQWVSPKKKKKTRE